ncbi:MAG: hypothetical protein K2Q10_07590, partial [Rhodospirillales bacterium]|nr:hypothetical protein [Rhodospirillales bacterium]
GGGQDVASDFRAEDFDRIELPVGASFTVSSAANGSAMIVLDDGTSLTLTGIQAAQVKASWFVFG